ncbi:glutathione S-transferase family protein [Enterobacter hormaechei]|uniref:glutathione S-transferase family protein n=1 Tax=Enterobacter hormaechei TaxID=158836 RepID=UPI00300CEC3A
MIKLYGVPGWGSAISEVMLTLADIPYQFVNVDGFDQPGPQRELLLKLNPLCQVPTLELENGAIVTETAAIALMVLDRRPDLAPPVGQAERQQFQRLLIWFVANVYPTFTYADYPGRWVPDAPEQLKKNCIEYRKSLYLWFDSQLSASPYAFGQQLTLLDVYIAVVRTWGPGHEWFTTNAPNITAIADAVCALPELHKVLKANDII